MTTNQHIMLMLFQVWKLLIIELMCFVVCVCVCVPTSGITLSIGLGHWNFPSMLE